uniref:Zinc fingers and homeoboxes protein 1 n=1 Tax=Ornithorhynchus anatinus TaxID=9258 RepID=A0A6I8NMR8_ORNAN
MASRRKSTPPCMVLASQQVASLETVAESDEGPPLLAPAETSPTVSPASAEDARGRADDGPTKRVEGGYECKYCTFQTPDLNLFTFHVDSEHPNVVLNSSYVCTECNFLTKRYDALSDHNLKHHPGEENFKLIMVKGNNQTIFEQTVNDLTFDGSFVREEAEAARAEPPEPPSPPGISISKTPIMKMMKTRAETKRIAVFHSPAGEPGEEREREADRSPASSDSGSAPGGAPPDPPAAPVLRPGFAQVIATVSAPQNPGLLPKVLIPVSSIPAYNASLDANPLLLSTYNRFPYPTGSEITVLSAQARHTEEQIKIWFSAQRLKHGVSWTPEEVEEARQKQFNGAVHTVPQTITVIPAHLSPAGNGLPSILQTCQIVGQPGLVLTQVAGAAPIALTVAGVPAQPQAQKSRARATPPPPPPGDGQPAAAPAPPQPRDPRPEAAAPPDAAGVRAKKTKEQLAELKVSYLRGQFPSDAEIARLMGVTGLTKGEIKKWFSDTRYNQRNAKGHQGGPPGGGAIVIDSGDETAEPPPAGGGPRLRGARGPAPDLPPPPPKAREKTAGQAGAPGAGPVPSDGEPDGPGARAGPPHRDADARFAPRRRPGASGREDRGEEEEEEEEDDDDDDEEGQEEEEEDDDDDEAGPGGCRDGAGGGGAAPGEEAGGPRWSAANKAGKKSPEQLHLLKSAFVRTQWPSAEEYDGLARESGLARTDIVSWFGDTRYAWKNGNLKWYFHYHHHRHHHRPHHGPGPDRPNGQPPARRRGRGRPKGRGRGRPRGRPRGGAEADPRRPRPGGLAPQVQDGPGGPAGLLREARLPRRAGPGRPGGPLPHGLRAGAGLVRREAAAGRGGAGALRGGRRRRAARRRPGRGGGGGGGGAGRGGGGRGRGGGDGRQRHLGAPPPRSA